MTLFVVFVYSHTKWENVRERNNVGKCNYSGAKYLIKTIVLSLVTLMWGVLQKTTKASS